MPSFRPGWCLLWTLGCAGHRLQRADETAEMYRLAAQHHQPDSSDQIELTKQLIAAHNPQGAQRAEALERLAELYAEEAREIYQREPDGDHTESARWFDKAIGLYQEVLQLAATDPTVAQVDRVSYALGATLRDAGRPTEALELFLGLVRTWPESRLIPDAYVQIGEYYYDTNCAYKAYTALLKATKYVDAAVYPYAMYMLAWCQYNVGEYVKAIETMRVVVSLHDARGALYDATGEALGDAPVADLVAFLDADDRLDEAWHLLAARGDETLRDRTMARAAEGRFERGAFDSGIGIYRHLIALDPRSPDAVDWQVRIVAARERIGRLSDTAPEVQTLVRDFGPGSVWAAVNVAHPEVIAGAMAAIEAHLYNACVTSPDAGLCTTYLGLFPNHPHHVAVERLQLRPSAR